jgi:hypothetical protein
VRRPGSLQDCRATHDDDDDDDGDDISFVVCIVLITGALLPTCILATKRSLLFSFSYSVITNSRLPYKTSALSLRLYKKGWKFNCQFGVQHTKYKFLLTVYNMKLPLRVWRWKSEVILLWQSNFRLRNERYTYQQVQWVFSCPHSTFPVYCPQFYFSKLTSSDEVGCGRILDYAKV